MRIAVASGKGGTGKTTIAAALAATWPNRVAAMDLDVEAPNLHLFLKPVLEDRRTAYMTVPMVDESKCTYCRACAELCQFKAISVFGNVLLSFPEMCHGCGGCMAVCPEGALMPDKRELGMIEWGHAGNVRFIMGRSRIGEAMSPPLMTAVKDQLAFWMGDDPADIIIDAPPGVSCPAVNAVMDADVVVLVTEPTPFGLYDLKLAHAAFSPLGKPMGLVVNRSGLGEDAIDPFSRDAGLPIWAEIPFSKAIAKAYARGELLPEAVPALLPEIEKMRARIQRTCAPAAEVQHA